MDQADLDRLETLERTARETLAAAQDVFLKLQAIIDLLEEIEVAPTG